MMNPSAATALISLALWGADVSAEHIAPQLAQAPMTAQSEAAAPPIGAVARDDEPTVDCDDQAVKPRLKVTRDDDTDLEVTVFAQSSAE